MFRRLHAIRQALTLALAELNNPPENLDNNDWKMISDCISILCNIEEITEQLSGEQYPRLSLVIPLVRGFQYNLQQLKPVTATGIELVSKLIETVPRRLGTLESKRHVANACLLDPRFKKIAFGSEDNASTAQRSIKDELSNMSRLRSAPAPAATAELRSQQSNDEMEAHTLSTHTSTETVPAKVSIWDHFELKRSSLIESSNNTSDVITALRQYLELPLLERHKNPLSYWKEMKTIMPDLYRLHLKYSCIPASSVPSESLLKK